MESSRGRVQGPGRGGRGGHGQGQRGGGGRGGARLGGGPAPHDVSLSRKLSSTLRHNAVKEGIAMRPDGYVKVPELLAHSKYKGVTEEQVRAVVKDNDKQRYALLEEDGVLLIRANQGHSLPVHELEVTPILSADGAAEVIHGTFLSKWPLIQKRGLSKMGRNHIHCAPGFPGESGVISGMRRSCEVFIYIDLKKALEDGIKFYCSANNVLLTDGCDGVLPPKYFAKVVNPRGESLL